MTLEETRELDEHTLLNCGWGYMEILKRISDGYLTLNYSDRHNNYNIEFTSFENIVEYGYEVETYNGWAAMYFKSENIEHEDDFGFCKPINI